MDESYKQLAKTEIATLLAVAVAVQQSDRPYVLQSEIMPIRQASALTLRRHIKKLEALGYIRRTIMQNTEGRPQAYEVLKTEEINAWLENYLKTEESKAPSQAYRTDVDKLLQSLLGMSGELVHWLRVEITNAF